MHTRSLYYKWDKFIMTWRALMVRGDNTYGERRKRVARADFVTMAHASQKGGTFLEFCAHSGSVTKKSVQLRWAIGYMPKNAPVTMHISPLWNLRGRPLDVSGGIFPLTAFLAALYRSHMTE